MDDPQNKVPDLAEDDGNASEGDQSDTRKDSTEKRQGEPDIDDKEEDVPDAAAEDRSSCSDGGEVDARGMNRKGDLDVDDKEDVPDAAAENRSTGSDGDEVDARGMKRKSEPVIEDKEDDFLEAAQENGNSASDDAVDARGGIMDYFGSLRGKPTMKPDGSNFTYKMNRRHRGYFVIINNKTFESKTRMSPRKGTDVDAEKLQKQFKLFNFQVCRYNDQTCLQMQEIMEEVGGHDHSDADCFACAMLSHGDDNGIIYGTDGVIHIDTLVAPFKGDKCLSLAGKPKLFFIQACRGDRLDSGTFKEDETDGRKLQQKQRIPAEADFLFAFSTVPGYYSWRNSAAGSWFVQSLCKALEKYGDREIMHILTRTNYYVAYEFESNCSLAYMTDKKQMSSIVSMLTKELYFISK